MDDREFYWDGRQGRKVASCLNKGRKIHSVSLKENGGIFWHLIVGDGSRLDFCWSNM